MKFRTQHLILMMIIYIIIQIACSFVMAAEEGRIPLFTSTTIEMEGLGSCSPKIDGVNISKADRETNAIHFAEADALRRAAMKINSVLVSWNRQGRIRLSQRNLNEYFLNEVEDIVFDHFERISKPDIKTFDDGSVRAKVKVRCHVGPVFQSLLPKLRFKLSFNRSIEGDVIKPMVAKLPQRARLIIEPFKELSNQRFTAEQKLAVQMFRSILMEKLRQQQFQVTLCNRDSNDWKVIQKELKFMTLMVAQGRAASNTDLVQRILGGTIVVTSDIAFLQHKSLFAVIRVTDFKSGELFVVNAFLPNPISEVN